jgi:hypothetical protein
LPKEERQETEKKKADAVQPDTQTCSWPSRTGTFSAAPPAARATDAQSALWPALRPCCTTLYERKELVVFKKTKKQKNKKRIKKKEKRRMKKKKNSSIYEKKVSITIRQDERRGRKRGKWVEFGFVK